MIQSSKLSIVLFLLIGTVSSGYSQYSKIEENIGEITERSVRETMGYYEDASAMNLILRVGQNLEKHLEKDYDFKYFLVDSPTPNAFATAGGYVFVTRGLLALVNYEDELAGVLGHEFMHVIEHHSEKTLFRAFIPGVLELPGHIVGAITFNELGRIINFPIELTSMTVGSAFSRGQENQADRGGVDLARRAGYDPMALIAILNRLEEEVEFLTGERSKRHLFDDHPMTKERVKRIRKHLEGSAIQLKAPVPVISEIDDLLIDQNPDYGFLKDADTFVHPKLELAIDLPDGWLIDYSPSSLSSYSTKNHSALVASQERDFQTIADAIVALEKKIDEEKDLVVQGKTEIDIRGIQGMQLRAVKQKGKHRQHSIFTWIQVPDSEILLRLVGTTAKDNMVDRILACIDSIRMMEESDLEQVYTLRLEVVKAEAETFTEFVQNQNAEWYLDLLQILNGMDADTPVKGRMVKMVREIPYQKSDSY